MKPAVKQQLPGTMVRAPLVPCCSPSTLRSARRLSCCKGACRPLCAGRNSCQGVVGTEDDLLNEHMQAVAVSLP